MKIKCYDCGREFDDYDELEKKEYLLCIIDNKPYYESYYVCPYCLSTDIIDEEDDYYENRK